MFKTIFSAIIVPLLTAILGFFIEYSCFADKKSCLPNFTSAPAISFFIMTFCVSAFLISLYNLGQITLNQEKYFREDYSLEASVSICWLLITLAFSFSTKLMPWQVFIIIIQGLSGNTKRLTSSPPWSEYIVLILVVLVLSSIILTPYLKSWQGKKSTQQYDQEQRNEEINLFNEGIREFVRRLRREPKLVEYIPSDANSFATLLESVSDSIKSWEMKARQLVRLSSTSYDFDEDDWHDKQGVWVGKNIDTQQLVFLYPVQIQLNKNYFASYELYAQNFAHNQNQMIDEIIIAFEKEEDRQASPNSYKNFRFETEKSLLDNLVKFIDYYRDIRKRVEDYQLPQSTLTLKDVYVPSFFEINNYKSSETKENLETYLTKWLSEPSKRQIALLGEYGQGKSSAALMFTYNLLLQNSLPRIPIIIELRGTSPRNLSPLELLGAWASKYRIDSQALMRLHVAGRLLIIFEGFDEMALSGNREERIKHFKTLWQFCYPQAKIIITGRPNFFLDDKELKTALGVHQPIGDNPYCDVIQLSPFSVEQIHESLKEQKEEIQEQISSLARTNKRFYDVVSRPSLLHVVSCLWDEEKLGEKIGLINSAYVMGRFVQHSYRRQGLKSQDSRDFMALNSSEREYFMEGIACFMASLELNNQIDGLQLNKLVKNLIDVIPDSVSSNISVIPNEETRPLKQRMKNHEDEYLEHIQTDVRTCGLLVSDLSSLGKFKFGHKSFMEYLVANVASQIIKQDRDYLEKNKAIIKITYFELSCLINLPVSIQFIAELLGIDINKKGIQPAIYFKNQLIISRYLFNQIFKIHNDTFEEFIIHFFVFDASYVKSLKKIFDNSSKKEEQFLSILGRYFSPITILTILIFSVYFLVYKILYIYQPKTMNFVFIMFVFVLITIIGCVPSLSERYSFFNKYLLKRFLLEDNLTTDLKKKKSTNSRIHIWNKICKDIGIEDEVLHEIAWTKWFPWARNQPFDYFLDNSDNSNP